MKLGRWIAVAALVVVTGSVLGRTVGDGWAWTTLVAFGFLAVYWQVRLRAWLIVGCTLAGVGASMLLGGLGVPGAFWLGLAGGTLAIDAIDRGTSWRATRVGAALGLVGLVTATTDLGWWGDGRGPFTIALVILAVAVFRGPLRRPSKTDR